MQGRYALFFIVERNKQISTCENENMNKCNMKYEV